MEWGVSEKLGPQHFGGKSENVSLGRDMNQSAHLSEETSRKFAEEVKLIIHNNYSRAKKAVSENMPILRAMSEALLEYETIDKEDIDVLMEGRTLEKKKFIEPTVAAAAVAQDEKKAQEQKKGEVIDLAKP